MEKIKSFSKKFATKKTIVVTAVLAAVAMGAVAVKSAGTNLELDEV